MHANLPEIAKRWERDYASGGIARLGYQQGNWVAPFYNTNVIQGSLIPPDLGIYNYQYPRGTDIIGMDEMNTYGQLPMGTDTIGMNEMFSYPKIKPDYNFGRDIDQTYTQGNEFNVNPKQPAWYKRMFNKVGQGITGLKNKFRGGWDQSQNFVKNIMDNTMIGRVAAGFDATNPRAFNYNPALQGQIDFMKEQGMYGTNPTSGLNQIRGGVLSGKNLQSIGGLNDLGALYEKSIAQTEKTLAGLPEQWSRLKNSDDPEDQAEYWEKVALHKARLQKKQNEYNIFKANQEKIRQENIAKEKAFVTQGLGVTAADAATSGKGMDHTAGMTARERGAAASRMGGGSRQAKSGSQKAGGSGRTDGGWGWAQGGIVSLWPK